MVYLSVPAISVYMFKILWGTIETHTKYPTLCTPGIACDLQSVFSRGAKLHQLARYELFSVSGLSSGFSFVASANISSNPFSFTAFLSCNRTTSVIDMVQPTMHIPVRNFDRLPIPFRTSPHTPSVSPGHALHALREMTMLRQQVGDILRTRR